MSQPIFYEGQEVGCLVYGEGTVYEVNSLVYVNFGQDRYIYYPDGKFYRAANPTLYPIDQYREIIANLPAPQPEPWKPKPGEWCWFWDQDNTETATLAQLENYNKGWPLAYQTSEKTLYGNCAQFTGDLPPHLKEVKP